MRCSDFTAIDVSGLPARTDSMASAIRTAFGSPANSAFTNFFMEAFLGASFVEDRSFESGIFGGMRASLRPAAPALHSCVFRGLDQWPESILLPSVIRLSNHKSNHRRPQQVLTCSGNQQVTCA